MKKVEDMGIQSWLMDKRFHPMNRDMTAEEFAVYALTYKKLGEGWTVDTFIQRFPRKHLWVVKRVLKETMVSRRKPIVNWCVVRSALATNTSGYDPKYERHVFNDKPERFYYNPNS